MATRPKTSGEGGFMAGVGGVKLLLALIVLELYENGFV
jgi:hypothetical protein